MNKTLISAGLAFSIVVAGLAPAMAQVNEPSVPVPAPARATATYDLKSHEFDDYAYSYRLSNGQVAEFTEQNNRYFVVVRNHPAGMAVQAINASRDRPVQLLAVAPGRFVTRGGVELSFANEGDMVTIANFERLPAAKVAAADAGKTMVAFR